MCIVYALNEPEHRKHINELKNTHKQHSWDEQKAVVGGVGGKERTPSSVTGAEERLMKKRVEKCCGQGEETKMKKQKKVEPPAPTLTNVVVKLKTDENHTKKKANQGGVC